MKTFGIFLAAIGLIMMIYTGSRWRGFIIRAMTTINQFMNPNPHFPSIPSLPEILHFQLNPC